MSKMAMSSHTCGTRCVVHSAHEEDSHTIYGVYMFNFEFKMSKDNLFLLPMKTVEWAKCLSGPIQVKREELGRLSI